MLKRFRIPIILLLLFFLVPLIMHILWQKSSIYPINIIILDKTVLDKKAYEHSSLIWLLKNNRFVKRSDSSFYELNKDYYGFYPSSKGKFFREIDFKGYSPETLDSIEAHNDMMYITDTYGIYSNEWLTNRNMNERSILLYGGLREEELDLLKRFKTHKKLIITEFNTFASPTTYHVRHQFEKEFKVHWTGWVGRYYGNLDSSNNDLPYWLKNNYKDQHGGKWPFKHSGIVLVSYLDEIEILEDKVHLEKDVPQIYTPKKYAEYYNIPEVQKYPFWFDITTSSYPNEIVSYYKLHTNHKGDSILKKCKINNHFPAVIAQNTDSVKFYYLAGDFCDNKIPLSFSKFKYISVFKRFLYNTGKKEKREDFFWEYYRPLLNSILFRYYNKNIAAPFSPQEIKK